MNKILLTALLSTAIVATGVQAKHHNDHMGSMFDMMDTNKDGKVSRTEANMKANERFDMADSNKDGYVTREEMKDAKSKYKEKTHHHKTRKHDKDMVDVPETEGVIKDIKVKKSELRNELRVSPIDDPKIKTPLDK